MKRKATFKSICYMIAVRRVYNGGAKIVEIARHLKRSPSTIRRILRSTGVSSH